MTCRDVIVLLADFFDDALPDDAGSALRAHLDGCDEC
jgi:hypothetical protein